MDDRELVIQSLQAYDLSGASHVMFDPVKRRQLANTLVSLMAQSFTAGAEGRLAVDLAYNNFVNRCRIIEEKAP